MITKKRLERLIKEGATIWALRRYVFQDKIEEIKFSVSNSALIYADLFYTKLEDLFETKEQAEWALKYHATRTEELYLPMWEEFVCETFIGNEGLLYTLVKSRSGKIYLWTGHSMEKLINEWEGTKENYVEVCKLCIKLFKGENKC